MADLTRRQLVARGVSGGGAVLLTGSPFLAAAARRDARRDKLIRGGRFLHGVAAGAPATNGAILWTRLTGLERGGRIGYEVAADRAFRRVLVSGRTVADSKVDYAAELALRSRRLKPGEDYWYRFFTRDRSSRPGRFRTALPPDSRDPVRIGFFSCQKWHQGYYTAHRGLAKEEDLDVVVALGDYIYEEPAETRLVEERQDNTGALKDGDVQSLPEYRQKYRLYQSDPDLQIMHSRHAVIPIWDDHEAEDDYAGENEGDPLRERRVAFEERKRAGYRAFFESLPIRPRRDDPLRIYGSRRIGQAELFTLDTRQYRDALACPSVTPCPQGEAPGRSILGDAQREWLKGALAGSGAAWKVIANQVMMMTLDVPTGVPINADQWDGYAAERRELLEHALAQGVQDIAVITGDIHTFFAGTVTTTGDAAGRPAATEFVGGSITSTGIAEDLEKRGIPRNTEGGQESGLRGMNPHITYAEVSAKGYGVLEAKQDELLVTFRTPETVLEPKSKVNTLARFRVAPGGTDVEVL
jgi:alkaline phosphatase D